VEALINLLCLAYPFIVHLVEVETLILYNHISTLKQCTIKGYARHSKLIRAFTSTRCTIKGYVRHSKLNKDNINEPFELYLSIKICLNHLCVNCLHFLL
jgi:hypothetical protein